MDFVTVVSTVFAAIGLVMLGLAARQLFQRRAFLRNSVTATGEIVELIEVMEGIEVNYFPKVMFRTAAGEQVTFQSKVGGHNSRRRVDQRVTVRYRPDQPHDAEIDSFFSLWGLTLSFGLWGGIFTFVGLGILAGWVPV